MNTKVHIRKDPEQRLFFTSDLHFGHKGVLTFCDRPFSDVKEMNLKLVQNWNETVSDQDIVFILGDLFWWNYSKIIKQTLERLNGKEIYIIPGNHDDFDHYYRVEDPRIHLMASVVQVWVGDGLGNKEEVCLSHYPMITWPHRDHGVIQLFGHIHSGPRSKNAMDIPGQDIQLIQGQQYDVGVDNNEYRPVELSQIKSKLCSCFVE